MANKNGTRKRLGKYIVADSEICHGKPTFKGTRAMVHLVLESLNTGWTVEETAHQWDLPVEAIQEAVELAARTTLKTLSVPGTSSKRFASTSIRPTCKGQTLVSHAS